MKIPEWVKEQIEQKVGAIGQAVGNGAHGKVLRFDQRRVIKVIEIREEKDERIFNNEVAVGTDERIAGVVGPKVYKNLSGKVERSYQYKLGRKTRTRTETYAYYVMDDIASADEKTLTLHEYMNSGAQIPFRFD